MIWYAGGNFGFFNFFVSHKGIRKIDGKIFNSNYETDYVTGCCLFISKENFLKLNGFDESFNMYGEDVDLCIRAYKLGMKCYYISDSKFCFLNVIKDAGFPNLVLEKKVDFEKLYNQRLN